MTALEWRKSSYTGGSGNCVEIAWRKSSYSGGTALRRRWRGRTRT